jgi:biopolymer transport protein ExbD
MRLTRQRQRSDVFEVVVTSMLDINFLLIMFFMMTAQFQKETRAELQLPQERGEQKAEVDEAGLVINITHRGDIVVSHQTLSLEELRQRVQAEIDRQSAGSSERVKLMVRCDRQAQTEEFNRIVTMLRELGVGTIRIATEMPI